MVTPPSRSLEDRFRRVRRIRSARSWLHLAAGLCGVAIVLLVIRGPWLGIPVALGVIVALQLVRYWIGRSLPRSSGPRRAGGAD